MHLDISGLHFPLTILWGNDAFYFVFKLLFFSSLKGNFGLCFQMLGTIFNHGFAELTGIGQFHWFMALGLDCHWSMLYISKC